MTPTYFFLARFQSMLIVFSSSHGCQSLWEMRHPFDTSSKQCLSSCNFIVIWLVGKFIAYTRCKEKNKQITIQDEKKRDDWGNGVAIPNKNQERIFSKCLCYGRLKGNRCEMIGSDLNKDKQTQPHRLIGIPSFFFSFVLHLDTGGEEKWIGSSKKEFRLREPTSTPEKLLFWVGQIVISYAKRLPIFWLNAPSLNGCREKNIVE